ncbi:hypothetical protein R4Z10_09855 [Niallia sp. XMNu-256]
MKTNKRQQIHKTNNKDKGIQNTTDHLQEKEGVTAQNDGFRYDYNDNF